MAGCVRMSLLLFLCCTSAVSAVEIKPCTTGPKPVEETVYNQLPISNTSVDQKWWETLRPLVPYRISKAVDETCVTTIKNAMWYMQNESCTSFYDMSQEGADNYTRFIMIEPDPDSNYFAYDTKPGTLIHTLGLHNCDFGIVVHELMHALGFDHEHQRHDRDAYITILQENIEKENIDQIVPKRPENEKQDSFTPYDYGSILHYDSKAFSRNGQPTIVPREAGIEIGQRNEFSSLDKVKLNRYYQCYEQDPSNAFECVDKEANCSTKIGTIKDFCRGCSPSNCLKSCGKCKCLQN